MAEVEISVVGENIRAKLGEGPHWDTATQKLLWVDCFDPSVHVLDVETGKVNLCVGKLVDSVTLAQILRSVALLSSMRCRQRSCACIFEVLVCVPLDQKKKKQRTRKTIKEIGEAVFYCDVSCVFTKKEPCGCNNLV